MLLPEMCLFQKLGCLCLLCDLSKTFAGGYVTFLKALLPVV
jgi:hypothetical protein